MNTEPKLKLTLPGKTANDQSVSNFLLALDTAIARANGEGLSQEIIAEAMQQRATQVRVLSAPRGWDSVTA